MIARREHLGPRQAMEPRQVVLQVAMVAGHRQVTGNQDQVAGSDHLPPVLFDLHGMVAPARGERSRRSGRANERCRSEIAQTFI